MIHAKSQHNRFSPKIAIIGMVGRFPGAQSVEDFWHNLCNGVESISFFSQQELKDNGIDDEKLADPNYVKASGMLQNAAFFDAPFFGYNPREAETMDPQQRIFLELAYEALEDAGYNPETYEGAIGVFGGAHWNSYSVNNIYANDEFREAVGEFPILVGNNRDHIATRVSYKLNLRGPGINVQTACSTALVSIHEACRYLQNRECDMALAGGISVRVPQQTGFYHQEGGIWSSDGHCRAFDARANGTVFTSGAGIVVLKRLEEAVAHGDNLHAVIRGSAVNNDGSLKVGFTAPGINGQRAVIKEAIKAADINPEEITYIETHGTGTPVGDPIEITALVQAFREKTKKKQFCAIGSVKTNIGHLGAPSGAASLIKTVMAMKHKLLPPTLHFQQPNPNIDFRNSPFYVNNKLTEWKPGNKKYYAGISSFGVGGTNAHIIIEEPPAQRPSAASRPWQLLTISANSEDALEKNTDRLYEYLKKSNGNTVPFADVAFTLNQGRKPSAKRRILISQSGDDSVQTLEKMDPTFVAANIHGDGLRKRKKPVFMFPGQGTQYVNMALGIYQSEPVFRKEVDRCAEILQPILNEDIRAIIYPGKDEEKAARKLITPRIAQPALFVIEYALAKLFIQWGISPKVMIGHSVGEYAAACLAGVFSLEDALYLVSKRGQFIQELPPGKMISVSLPEQEVKVYLDENISIAAINSPSHCILSGPAPAMEALEKQLTADDIDHVLLHIAFASHSPMVDPVLEDFGKEVRKVSLKPPRIPIVSIITGDYISKKDMTDPGYWVKNLRETVRFSQVVQKLLNPDFVFLEVGPSKTLTTLVKSHPGLPEGQVIIQASRHIKDQMADLYYLYHALGNLWLAGLDINWGAFYSQEIRNRVQLPTYSFDRHYYWVNPQKQSSNLKGTASLKKRANMADWFYIPSWKRSVPHKLLEAKELPDKKGCCLLLSDSYGIGANISQHLEKQGHEVVIVISAQQYTKPGDNSYTIDNKQYPHYEKLFEELQKAGKPPVMIIHLWSLTKNDAPAADTGLTDENIQYSGFYSLLFLAQVMAKYFVNKPGHISVVSNGVMEFFDNEGLYPEKATILGPCKVIPAEFPNITCNYIDIVFPGPDGEEKLIANLLKEFDARPDDLLIAHRHGNRWVQGYEPVPLNNKTQYPGLLREQGVYLIVGGMGGVGLVLAEYIAQRVRGKLVLTGRSTFPPRQEWEQWLKTHDSKEGTSTKIKKIRELEELGAGVLVLEGDVVQWEDMRRVMKETRQRFGNVNGIINAAGSAPGGMIQLKTREVADTVLAPKVKGTKILNSLIEDQKIDFMMLCSSLASVLGGVGRVDYCAANAFLDAFAHYNTSKNNINTIAINWDMWQEVGLGVTMNAPTGLDRQRREVLSNGLLSSEGMEVFERILHAEIPQVVVSTWDLQQRIERRRNELRSLDNLQPARGDQPDKKSGSRPKLPNTYVAPRNEIETAVAQIWQKIFGIDKVGVNDDFFQLGGHSLLATQLLNRLQKDFSAAELSLRDLFDNPTVAKTAQTIEKSLGQKISQEQQPVKELFFNTFPTDRVNLLESYFKEKIAGALKVQIDQIPDNGDLKAFDLESITTDLIWELKRDFQLPVYPHEILRRPSVKMIARFISDELEYMDGVKDKNLDSSEILVDQLFVYEGQRSEAAKLAKPGKKNKSMTFLLCAPRTGSTLLRLMLAGHPRLFCPPELRLLSFRSIDEWARKRLLPFSREGIVIALMEVMNIGENECRALVEEMVQKNMSIREVYHILQQAVGDRILVDKTPRYSMHLETLEYAEEIFDKPKYIHLVRHPYPVIESFMRNRFEKLFLEEDVDSFLLADKIWNVYNRNVIQFSKTIEPDRYHLVPYETVVSQPKEIMKNICEFLGIPFEESIIDPYDGKRRMIDGPGDPNIFQHDKIESNLGEVWKKISLPRPLSNETGELALELGYTMPQQA
jgi:phthiocerol/phenolphthiocerol synthesis type-I polyketide synthase E